MTIKKICGLWIAFTMIFCLSLPMTVTAESSEAEALKVMEDWIRANNERDYELMVSLYWNSPETSEYNPRLAYIIQGFDKISDGCEDLKEPPVGTSVFSAHHPQAIMLKDDVAVLTQYFSVTSYDPKTDNRGIAYVRQTFVVQKIEGKWLIVHDHASSGNPK